MNKPCLPSQPASAACLSCRGRYWSGEEEGREALLPRISQADPDGGTPRAAGYHTPPSRFQSPYASPVRPLRGAAPAAAPGSAPPPLPGAAH